jgi:hypothetical protein
VAAANPGSDPGTESPGSRTVSRFGARHLGETGPLSQGVQAGRKALRIRHINGMEVRKKGPRGFKKEAQGVQVSPLNPLSVAPCHCPGRKPAFLVFKRPAHPYKSPIQNVLS